MTQCLSTRRIRAISLSTITLCAFGLAGCSEPVSKDNLHAVVDHVNRGGADHIIEDFPGTDVTARIENGGTLVLKVTNFP